MPASTRHLYRARLFFLLIAHNVWPSRKVSCKYLVPDTWYLVKYKQGLPRVSTFYFCVPSFGVSFFLACVAYGASTFSRKEQEIIDGQLQIEERPA